MKRPRYQQTSGNAMVELIIIIPVYVILLSGTIYLGTIMLAQQKCLIAARQAAWGRGAEAVTTSFAGLRVAAQPPAVQKVPYDLRFPPDSPAEQRKILQMCNEAMTTMFYESGPQAAMDGFLTSVRAAYTFPRMLGAYRGEVGGWSIVILPAKKPPYAKAVSFDQQPAGIIDRE